MTRDESLKAVSDAIASARSITELLEVITEKARELVGAHQATTSVVFGGNWAKAVHAVSLSDKYSAWRAYDERPDGSGIYRLVYQLSLPMRLTQAELQAHSAWRGFGAAAGRHPPMRGWLAVPLRGRGGQNIGLIQLSDKYEGEFSQEDETLLVELERLASVTLENLRRSAREQRRRDAVAPPRPRRGEEAAMETRTPYSINLEPRYAPLELIDFQALVDACKDAWYNQTLCRVNDCVVRLGVLEGEFHWHKHDKEDEFFYVIDGHFEIDLEGRTVELRPRQGFTVPKAVIHRTRAPERTVVLMIAGASVVPTGD